MRRLTLASVPSLALLLTLAACGGTSEAASASADSTSADSAAADSTPAAAAPAASPAKKTTADAGSKPADRAPSPAQRTLATGVEMNATLDDSLDTESLEAGTAFTATLADAVVQDEHVVVPTGSRVYGRVTEVRQPSGDQRGVIVLALDSIQVRETTRPLSAEITNADVTTRGEMKDEGKKIGGGAAAGAIIGAIVGKDVKGAVIGAAAGAAAGTAIALGTKEQYGVLPKGTALTLRLTEALTVAVPR